jgi:serine/threonine protein kinase
VDGPLFALLPASDQVWVSALRVNTMAPLLGSTGELFGIVVLGEARHGLPYSAQDHALVRSMSAQVGLRVENQWLRDRPPQQRHEGLASRHSGGHWQQEPAELCLRCSRALPPTTTQCGCGSAVVSAALPLVTAGKFRLERQLGSGGMGVVYLATDLVLGRRVALKTLPRVSDSLAGRLERVAISLASVLHPNLALIYGAEQWRGNPVLIVEYLEGGTVLDSLRRGPFTVQEALGLGILIADVLDRLHGAGILHRDVKPSNIGYTLSGIPKLLDLGLAAAFAPHSTEDGPSPRKAVVSSLQGEYAVTSDSRQLGTLRYMAPEALEGQPPKPSFDLWALSLVLYEVIAGRHPLADRAGHGLLKGLARAAFPDIREIRPDSPPAIAQFFEGALAVDPARRPRTAAELRAALQSFLTPS